MYEAVLNDPEVVEALANRSRHDDGKYVPSLYGETDLISWLKTLVEVQTGKPLPRPKIPGLELRKQKIIVKTKNVVALAQERNQRKSKGN